MIDDDFVNKCLKLQTLTVGKNSASLLKMFLVHACSNVNAIQMNLEIHAF